MASWTPARCIALVVTTGLAIISLCTLASAWSAWKNFQAWNDAVPLAGPVDFSRPGVFELRFVHTCTTSHGTELNLLLPPGSDAQSLLHGASARLDILPTPSSFPAGSSLTFDNRPLIDAPQPGRARLFLLSGLPRGEYVARVTVESGAPALRDVRQELSGDYLLCGLEAMPALILAIAGGPMLLISALLFWLTFRFSRPPGDATNLPAPPT